MDPATHGPSQRRSSCQTTDHLRLRRPVVDCDTDLRLSTASIPGLRSASSGPSFDRSNEVPGMGTRRYCCGHGPSDTWPAGPGNEVLAGRAGRSHLPRPCLTERPVSEPGKSASRSRIVVFIRMSGRTPRCRSVRCPPPVHGTGSSPAAKVEGTSELIARLVRTMTPQHHGARDTPGADDSPTYRAVGLRDVHGGSCVEAGQRDQRPMAEL